MNLAVFLFILSFIGINPAWGEGFLFRSLKVSCPYEDLKSNNKKNCSLSKTKNIALETSLNFAQANCHHKNKSSLCRELKEHYPFIADQGNSCEPQSLCPFPSATSLKNALEVCHKGELRAAQEFGTELQQIKVSAEQILAKFDEDVSQVISDQTRQLWTALKSCVLDKSACSPSQILSYLKSLPAGLHEDLVELIETADALECLEPEARIELLCYVRASYGIDFATSMATGGVVGKGGKLLFGTFKKINGARKKTPALGKNENDLDPLKLPVVLTGRAKLEKKMSGPVEFEIMHGSKKIDAMKSELPAPSLFTVYSKSKARLGDMRVTYEAKGKTLHIDSMFTEEEFRKMGVGEALMEKAIQEFPDTQIISVKELTQTNKERVQKSLVKSKSERAQPLQELEDAIKESPAYKIRSNLGYCEIIPDSINPQTLGFKVRCPGE